MVFILFPERSLKKMWSKALWFLCLRVFVAAGAGQCFSFSQSAINFWSSNTHSKSNSGCIEQLLSVKTFWWIHKIRKELYPHNDCHTCYGQCGLSLCEQKGPSWLCLEYPLFYIFIFFFLYVVLYLLSMKTFLSLTVSILLLSSFSMLSSWFSIRLSSTTALSLSLQNRHGKLLHLRVYNKDEKKS